MSTKGQSGRSKAESEPHRVRLWGPWTRGEDGLRVKLPATWREALGDAERVVLSRSFNRPPRVDPSTVEFRIALASPQRIERVLVNDQPVGDGGRVDRLLEGGNRLTVELSRGDSRADLLEAHLELHERG